ncbi:MAG: DUF1330 domain-containing protein [Pseudomonadota bacterium]
MGAFFIVTVTVKDPEKFQEYAAKAGPTFAAFGGKLITKGKAEKTLAGHSDHKTAAVIGFPDIEALHSWYQSDAYQALIPLRDAAADMTMTSYSEPS